MVVFTNLGLTHPLPYVKIVTKAFTDSWRLTFVREGVSQMETTLKKLKHPTRDNLVYLLAKFFFSALTSCELYYFSAYLTDVAMLQIGIVGLVLTATSVIDTLFSLINGVVLQKIGDLMP